VRWFMNPYLNLGPEASAEGTSFDRPLQKGRCPIRYTTGPIDLIMSDEF